jgi:hypothetical protein
MSLTLEQTIIRHPKANVMCLGIIDFIQSSLWWS